MKVIPIDVYDKDGNLTKIEFQDADGAHVIDAVWDPSDEQTSENRVEFRNWAYKMIKRKDYEVDK
jgi:hypothetical protein